MKLKINIYIKILLMVTSIYFLILTPFFLSSHPIVLDYDVIRQQQPLYFEFHNLLDTFFNNGSMPFYSWNYFLGTDFYSSKAFYLTGDLFAWFSYLLKSLNFYDMMMFLNYIKFLVSGLLMFIFLKKINIRDNIALLGVILYTFSSYFVYFQNQSQFASFYALLPLVFIGIEYFFEEKPYIFIISIAILCLTNFYSFFSLSLFLPFYFIYRYGTLKQNYKGFFISTFKLIGLYIIGLLLSSILFVPAIIFILNNNRVGQSTFNPLFYSNIKTYINIIASFFLPSHTIYLSQTARIFDVGLYSLDELFSFTSNLVPLVFIYVVIIKKSKLFTSKVTPIILFFLLALSVPFANVILHGFSEPSFRSNIFLVFISSMFVSIYLENHSLKIDNAAINKSLIAIILIIMLIPIILIVFGNNVVSVFQPEVLIIIISSIIFSILYVYNLKRGYVNYLLVIIIFQAIFSNLFYMHNTLVQYVKEDVNYIHKITDTLENSQGDLKNTLTALNYDNPYQFYRVLLEEGSVFDWGNLNSSVLYNIKSISSYDSTYSTSINNLIYLEPDIENFRSINISDENLINFLSTKYAIVDKNSNMCNASSSWLIINSNFRNNYMICENLKYIDFGISYDKIMTIDEYLANPNTVAFIEYIISNKDDEKVIQQYLSDNKIILKNIYYNSNYLSADISSTESGFIVLTIPYDKGWNIKIDNNNVDFYMVNGGFIGVHIPENSKILTMQFVPQGFNLGAVLSGLGLLLFVFVIIKKRKEG